ncbi:hypothetical protein OUZ56_011978 [Daphnia magna]|uniref:Uncharacterized protein n=1 Tax=Daphnia magna TaxID=35525 RepID=A0ABQ9Z2Z8_9CRUS|nr:hypothetical protein OUZ56_011978 [Daphnia magna]
MESTLNRLKTSSGSVADLVEKTWLSTHYKILDIARPLIQLWGLFPPDDMLNQYVESALRLWGVAFSEVTKNRRKNILRQISPGFVNLLSDQSLFSNRETCRLFGVHFLNALSKEADEESKIAKIRRNRGSHRRLTRYSFRSSRGAKQETSYGSHQPFNSSAFFQPAHGSGSTQRSGSESFEFSTPSVNHIVALRLSSTPPIFIKLLKPVFVTPT